MSKKHQQNTYDKEVIKNKRDKNAEYKKRKRNQTNEKNFDRHRARQRDSERSREIEYFN